MQLFIRHRKWALSGPCRHGICARSANRYKRLAAQAAHYNGEAAESPLFDGAGFLAIRPHRPDVRRAVPPAPTFRRVMVAGVSFPAHREDKP